MKRSSFAGAASIAAVALSLFLGGGAAQAQEAPTAPQPLDVSALSVVDSLHVAVPDIPSNPIAPVNEVLSFLADSITMVGRDVLAKRTVETATLRSDSDPAKGADLQSLAIKAAPFAAIPVLGVIGGIAGALVGAGGGAGVAVFAGIAAAALTIAPAVIASPWHRQRQRQWLVR